MTPFETVKRAREDRFTALGLINGLFTGFIECHGDRLGADDPSIIGGIAWCGAQPVTVIAVDKGSDLTDKLRKHNGAPLPSGYRKAMRLMREAAQFGRPIVTLINTPGAYPGKEAEEAGQGEAIAQSIMQSLAVPVPIIAIIYGEGGSGGALALATADQVWMFEHAVYAILSPEGFASILFKDAKKAEEAAAMMGLTAQELADKEIIDAVIPDTVMTTALYAMLQTKLTTTIQALQTLTPSELLTQRQARFRKF